MTRTYRRPGALAVLVGAAAIGLAACSSGSSTPQVASLGTTSSDGSGSSAATGSSTTSGASGSVTQLLSQWTGCMRSHGDANQATPTVDANKVIHVATPADYNGLLGLGGRTGTNSCTVYMNDASKALGGSDAANPPAKSLVPVLKFAECMRAHGVPDFPDPGSNGQGNVPPDSNTPTYHNASKICAAQTGLKNFAGTGAQAGSVLMAPAGAGSGANG